MIFIDRGIPSQNCGSNIDRFWLSFDKHKRHLLCTLCRMHIAHRIVINLYRSRINEYCVAHTQPKAVMDKYNTSHATVSPTNYSMKTVTNIFFSNGKIAYTHHHVALITFTRINTTAPTTDHKLRLLCSIQSHTKHRYETYRAKFLSCRFAFPRILGHAQKLLFPWLLLLPFADKALCYCKRK